MGKSIRVFLVDGTSTGIRTAEIVNWTGSVLAVPSLRLKDIEHRPELTRTGVYFLIGSDPETDTKTSVYVGEADSILVRLKQHILGNSKEFWTEAVVVTSKDTNLTKAHVRFLETKFIDMAKNSGRADIQNGNSGTSLEAITLPEADLSDMDDFIEQVRLVLPVLGYDFLQPSTSSQVEHASSVSALNPIFSLTQGKFHARAREIDGQFIVLKGSIARKQAQPSWTFFKNGRRALVEKEILKPTEDEECLVFVDDVPFNSPSAASASVLARNDNGRTTWKLEGTSTTYQEWLESKLE